MKTIEIHIRHGNCDEKETATAETIEAALAQIMQTPLGVGYGIQPGNRYYRGFIEELAASGRAQHGWADYSIVP